MGLTGLKKQYNSIHFKYAQQDKGRKWTYHTKQRENQSILV